MKLIRGVVLMCDHILKMRFMYLPIPHFQTDMHIHVYISSF